MRNIRSPGDWVRGTVRQDCDREGKERNRHPKMKYIKTNISYTNFFPTPMYIISTLGMDIVRFTIECNIHKIIYDSVEKEIYPS